MISRFLNYYPSVIRPIHQMVPIQVSSKRKNQKSLWFTCTTYHCLIFTKLDIVYIVHIGCQFVVQPTTTIQWVVVLPIIHYLQTIMNRAILLLPVALWIYNHTLIPIALVILMTITLLEASPLSCIVSFISQKVRNKTVFLLRLRLKFVLRHIP